MLRSRNRMEAGRIRTMSAGVCADDERLAPVAEIMS